MRAAQMSSQWVTADYRPGDVVIYDFPGGAATDHCGIVESVTGNGLVAIEGNTGSGSDADGGKVDDQGRPADLDLSRDMLRILVICDRAGVFG